MIFKDGDRVKATFPSGQVFETTITMEDVESFITIFYFGVQARLSLTSCPEILVEKIFSEREVE